MSTSNLIALVVAAFVPSIVGFIYYHPKVLGTYWKAAMGNSSGDFRGGFNRPAILLFSVVCSFFLAMAMKGIIDIAHEGGNPEQSLNNFGHGIFHALIFGLFFMLPVLLPMALNERRSWKLILINMGYWLISFALMGGVVDALY